MFSFFLLNVVRGDNENDIRRLKRIHGYGFALNSSYDRLHNSGNFHFKKDSCKTVHFVPIEFYNGLFASKVRKYENPIQGDYLSEGLS